jgi:hypothetical protein
VPQYCDCGLVLSRVHCVSLWLLCDGAALCGTMITVDCSWLCVSVRCVDACVTAALQWRVVLRVWCGWRRRRSLAVFVAH